MGSGSSVLRHRESRSYEKNEIPSAITVTTKAINEEQKDHLEEKKEDKKEGKKFDSEAATAVVEFSWNLGLQIFQSNSDLQDEVLAIGCAALPGIFAIAKECPFIAPLAGTLLLFYQSYQTVQANQDQFEKLVKRLDIGTAFLKEALPVLSRRVLSDFLERVLKNLVAAIQDCTEHIEKMNKRLSEGRKKSILGTVKNIILSDKDSNDLNDCYEKLDLAMKDLMAALPAVDALQKINSILDQLKEKLEKPLTFTRKTQQLIEKFQPGLREWLFEEIDTWFDQTTNTTASKDMKKPSPLKELKRNIFWLQAGAGMGKSVFAAALAKRFQGRKSKNSNDMDPLLGLFFFEHSHLKQCTPLAMINSLAYQLAVKFPSIQEEILKRKEALDTEPADVLIFFSDLIVAPLEQLFKEKPPPTNFLIIIDALDECGTEGDSTRTEFLSFLSQSLLKKLPPYVKLFITSRPEKDILQELRKFDVNEVFENDPRHTVDLKLFIQSKLSARMEGQELEKWTELMMKKSDKKFIYISMVLDDIAESNNNAELLFGSEFGDLQSDGGGPGLSEKKEEMIRKSNATTPVRSVHRYQSQPSPHSKSPQPQQQQQEQELNENSIHSFHGPTAASIRRVQAMMTSNKSSVSSSMTLSELKEKLASLPTGVDGFYRKYLDRVKALPRYKEFITILVSILEPLSEEEMSLLLGMSLEEIRQYSFAVQIIFPLLPSNSAKNFKYFPCHKSIIDWLKDETQSGDYCINAINGNSMIVKKLLGLVDLSPDEEITSEFVVPPLLEKDLGILSTYFFDNLLNHLDIAGQEELSYFFLSSLSWLQGRITQSGLQKLKLDYLKRVSGNANWLSHSPLKVSDIRYLLAFLRYLSKNEDTCIDWKSEICSQITGRFQLLLHSETAPLSKHSRIYMIVKDAMDWLRRNGGLTIVSTDCAQVGEDLEGMIRMPEDIYQLEALPNGRIACQSKSNIYFVDISTGETILSLHYQSIEDMFRCGDYLIVIILLRHHNNDHDNHREGEEEKSIIVISVDTLDEIFEVTIPHLFRVLCGVESTIIAITNTHYSVVSLHSREIISSMSYTSPRIRNFECKRKLEICVKELELLEQWQGDPLPESRVGKAKKGDYEVTILRWIQNYEFKWLGDHFLIQSILYGIYEQFDLSYGSLIEQRTRPTKSSRILSGLYPHYNQEKIQAILNDAVVIKDGVDSKLKKFLNHQLASTYDPELNLFIILRERNLLFLYHHHHVPVAAAAATSAPFSTPPSSSPSTSSSSSSAMMSEEYAVRFLRFENTLVKLTKRNQHEYISIYSNTLTPLLSPPSQEINDAQKGASIEIIWEDGNYIIERSRDRNNRKLMIRHLKPQKQAHMHPSNHAEDNVIVLPEIKDFYQIKQITKHYFICVVWETVYLYNIMNGKRFPFTFSVRHESSSSHVLKCFHSLSSSENDDDADGGEAEEDIFLFVTKEFFHIFQVEEDSIRIIYERPDASRLEELKEFTVLPAAAGEGKDDDDDVATVKKRKRKYLLKFQKVILIFQINLEEEQRQEEVQEQIDDNNLYTRRGEGRGRRRRYSVQILFEENKNYDYFDPKNHHDSHYYYTSDDHRHYHNLSSSDLWIVSKQYWIVLSLITYQAKLLPLPQHLFEQTTTLSSSSSSRSTESLLLWRYFFLLNGDLVIYSLSKDDPTKMMRMKIFKFHRQEEQFLLLIDSLDEEEEEEGKEEGKVIATQKQPSDNGDVHEPDGNSDSPKHKKKMKKMILKEYWKDHVHLLPNNKEFPMKILDGILLKSLGIFEKCWKFPPLTNNDHDQDGNNSFIDRKAKEDSLSSHRCDFFCSSNDRKHYFRYDVPLNPITTNLTTMTNQ